MEVVYLGENYDGLNANGIRFPQADMQIWPPE